MKPSKSRGATGLVDERIAQLEILVDELIKESPQETRIRTCMKAVGLEYSADPITRMEHVLRLLEGAKGQIKIRRKENDRSL